MSIEDLRRFQHFQQQQQLLAAHQARKRRRKMMPADTAIAWERTANNKVRAEFPDGGQTNAGLLFNASYTQGGLYPAVQRNDGQWYLNNRSHKPFRVFDEEEDEIVNEPILRWLDVVEIGTTAPFDRWDLYMCGGDEARRKIAELAGPIWYSNSFPDLLFGSSVSSTIPRSASCFSFRLTGPTEDDWIINYAESVWISGSVSNLKEYYVRWRQITPDGSDTVLYEIYKTPPNSGFDIYFSTGGEMSARNYINSTDTQLITWWNDSLTNTGSYSTVTTLPTRTITASTYPLPDVSLGWNATENFASFSWSWSSGSDTTWFTNQFSVNPGRTVSYGLGNYQRIPVSSPSASTRLISFKSDGNFITKTLAQMTDLVSPTDGYAMPWYGTNYLCSAPLANSFAFVTLDNSSVDGINPYSTTTSTGTGTARIRIYDADLNPVDAVDIDFVRPINPVEEWDNSGDLVHWWGYSLLPAIWIPDYSE